MPALHAGVPPAAAVVARDRLARALHQRGRWLHFAEPLHAADAPRPRFRSRDCARAVLRAAAGCSGGEASRHIARALTPSAAVLLVRGPSRKNQRPAESDPAIPQLST